MTEHIHAEAKATADIAIEAERTLRAATEKRLEASEAERDSLKARLLHLVSENASLQGQLVESQVRVKNLQTQLDSVKQSSSQTYMSGDQNSGLDSLVDTSFSR